MICSCPSARHCARNLISKDDALKKVPIVRFNGLDTHTPLHVVESWSVKRDKTEAAAVAAVTASATATASAHHPSIRTVDLAAGVDESRHLAQVAPAAALVSAYGQVRTALMTL
jgi:hypothetical protein